MASYKTPGVYVQEIQSLPASVAAVNTAVPVFIGCTEDNSIPGANVPVKIANMADYQANFGAPNPVTFDLSVTEERDGNGNLLTRSWSMATPEESEFPFNLYLQLQAYFANGGGDCYVISVKKYSQVNADPGGKLEAADFSAAFTALEKEDEPTLIVITDYPYDARTTAGDPVVVNKVAYGTVLQAALAHCDKMGDRFVICDVLADSAGDVTDDFRSAIGTSYLDKGAAYFPNLVSTQNLPYDEVSSVEIANYTLSAGASGPYAANSTLADLKTADNGLYNEVKAAILAQRPVLGPCGSVAGIYCATDRNRGVWKAPANVSIANVIGPEVKLSQADNDGLNDDPNSGKSVNAIRSFTGKGTLVWGARTLAGNSAEWRYIPVRRLFLMVEESVKKATEAVVFESNDQDTWLRTKGMIENFLNGIWRDGGLQGSKPSQAYFVNVGLGTTMTAQDVLEGRMIVEVGMAAVRPAEFIILKFSHKLPEA